MQVESLYDSSNGLAIQHIDEQVQLVMEARNEQIRLLMEARNKLVPISKLPPELLLLVFRRSRYGCRFAGIVDVDMMRSEDKWQDIINISHVCRSWRSAALGCPALWTHIICSRRVIIEEMLSRSKSSPISIIINSHFIANPIPAFPPKLLNIERLQAFHFYLEESGPLIHQLFSAMSGKSAPHLRIMIINNFQHDIHGPYTVPPHILALPMPRLQHLHLDQCKIPWDSLSHCNTLVSLRLDHPSIPSRRQFYGFLAANPDLETLDLSSALHMESDEDVSPARLPKLSSCTLFHSTLSECVDFQTHVIYPAERAKIDITPVGPGASEVALLKVLVSSCWRSEEYSEAFKQTSRSRLRFELTDDEGLYITLWQLPCQGRKSPSARIRPRSSDDQGQRPHYLEAFSLPGLCSAAFTVQPDSVCSREEWADFFGRHPGINRLRIGYDEVPELILTALSSHVDVKAEQRRSDSIPAGICLPELTTLILKPSDSPYVAQDAAGALLCKVCKCLSERRKFGLQPIKRLQLVGLGRRTTASSVTVIEHLRNLVENLEVN